ncbi:MAG: Rieske 2Fe-2S domain-containing protein [Planctomycetota bacterium]
MSESYRAVGWNRFKKRVDLLLAGFVATFLAAFVGISKSIHPDITDEIALMRATAVAGFVLLHLILAIGPLTRLDRRFLPLLYNRRHFGVTMFVLAFLHGLLATMTYHFGSDRNVFVSIFTTETGDSVVDFPFQPFGFLALLILFVMAVTSHDFWLRNLTAPVWKAIHMLVYLAYALLCVHVTFGYLQAEQGSAGFFAMGFGIVSLGFLHVTAGFKEAPLDRERSPAGKDGLAFVCKVDEIPEDRARIACVSGERIAVFKYGGKLSAVSNVCQHQNGPLGEGKIVDGCITCPWHGYQYRPEDGASPPPFTEKVPTFQVVLRGEDVFVDPTPREPGLRTEPVLTDQTTD